MPGPERGHEPLWPRAPSHEGARRPRPRRPRRCPATPRGPRPRARAPDPPAGRAGNRRSRCPGARPGWPVSCASASGRPSKGASTTSAPCTCCRRWSRPLVREGGRHALPGLVPRLDAGPRPPSLEAVDEPGHRFEGRHPARRSGVWRRCARAHATDRNPSGRGYTALVSADGVVAERARDRRGRGSRGACSAGGPRRGRTRSRPSRRRSWPTRGPSRTPSVGSPPAWPPSERPREPWAAGSSPRTSRSAAGRYGPPALHLSPRAAQQLRERGATRALVSLTHERLHAAACVLLLREGD